MGLTAARGLDRAAVEKSVEASEGFGDAEDNVPVDELLLSSSGLAERGGGEAVDLPQGPLGKLVQRLEGIVGEEGPLRPGGGESIPDVLGGVVDGGRGDEEAVMDACKQGA